MSDRSDAELSAIIAAGLGANKGFWMIQPRDDGGQWIEMGADVLFRVRMGDGGLVVATPRGVYVGPSGKPGKARVLVDGQDEDGIPSGVYEVDSNNLQQFQALLPEGVSSGDADAPRMDKFGRPVKTIEDSQLPALRDLIRGPITEDDRRYATGELTPEERKAEQDARRDSPIADMPAGFEAENPDEVKRLLQEAGVDPSEFADTPEADTPEADTPTPRADAGEDFRGRTPQDVIDGNEIPEGYLPEVQPGDNMVFDGRDRSIARENSRKARDTALMEKELGRKLTAEEKTLLGLNSRNTSPLGQLDNTPLRITNFNDPEVEDMSKARGVKLKALEAELAGDTPNSKNIVADTLAKEIMADVNYNGDAPNLDEVISDLKPLANIVDRKTSKKTPFDINKGDIVVGPDGKEYTVLDVTGGGEGKARLKLQSADGATVDSTVDLDREIDVVQGRTGRPAKPVTPAPPAGTAPETPETSDPPSSDTPTTPPTPADPPEAPRTPTVTPPKDEGMDPSDIPPNFPPANRVDDGTPIEHSPLDEDSRAQAIKKKIAAFINRATGGIFEYFDDKGKKRVASDPFELLDALAEAYPNAKFTPDGTALILDRRTDSDGRIFELRAENSGSKALIYTMRWTNPETGEFEELIHYDKRHSTTAVFRKDNGPDGLMARLLSGEPLEHGRKGSDVIPGDASLRERAQWFVKKQKMFTAEGLAVFYGNGRKDIFHSDGTLKNQEVPGVWDAVVAYKNDPNGATADDVYQRLMGVFGRIPMNGVAHAAARRALRAEFKRLYPEENMRVMGAFITNASRMSRGLSYDADPASRSNPFASKDRTRPIEVGMTIEYTNNVREKSILKVTGFAPNVGVTPGQNGDTYDYGDYIYVVDADGKSHRINSINAKILKNQDESLSSYSPNLSGEPLRERRAALGLYGVPGDAVPDTVSGTSSVSRDAPPPMPDIIDDLIEGDMLPNLKDGGTVGEIISSRFVTVKGEEAMAFVVITPEGEEKTVVYKLGREIPKKD